MAVRVHTYVRTYVRTTYLVFIFFSFVGWVLQPPYRKNYWPPSHSVYCCYKQRKPQTGDETTIWRRIGRRSREPSPAPRGLVAFVAVYRQAKTYRLLIASSYYILLLTLDSFRGSCLRCRDLQTLLCKAFLFVFGCFPLSHFIFFHSRRCATRAHGSGLRRGPFL